MMSFLTYITGFFMNFELLPIIQIRNFERGPPKDHSDKGWLKLAKWFLTRRFLNDFLLIGRCYKK
jgi:hypothetical protein